MLGISTCWWDDKSFRGDEIVSHALELGFHGIELEYRITASVYEQMKPQLKKELAVFSIHNFFPKPQDHPVGKGSGDLFLLSSTDKEARLTAVKYSIMTIEHANDLETQAVVLHLGRVAMENPMEDLKKLHGNGKIDQREGQAFVDEQKRIRKMTSQKNLDAVLRSLDRLNREAEKNGVFLGLENRYNFHEIPNFEEIGRILKEFEGGNLRYWHDVGHAAVQEKLGICTQKELLVTYSDMILGMHLHDLRGLEDHFSPGQGQMDYGEIRHFVQEAPIAILEVHSKVSRNDLLRGVQLIREMTATS
jgi:sugar phosphate isomerase/epimerase